MTVSIYSVLSTHTCIVRVASTCVSMNRDVGIHHTNYRGDLKVPLEILSAQLCVTLCLNMCREGVMHHCAI